MIIDNFLVIKGQNDNVIKTTNDLKTRSNIILPTNNNPITSINNNNNNNNKSTLNSGAESINDETFEDEEWAYTMKDFVPDTFNLVSKKAGKKIEDKSNKIQKITEPTEEYSDKRFIIIDG